jgi:HNH endonuclease
MPSRYIRVALRRHVRERAEERCEYCLLHQDDVPMSHHIDHILLRKHGGQTVSTNLALACLDCNRWKGSDLSAIDPATGMATLLFNPRVQVWHEHFVLKGAQIIGLTAVGRATAALLRFNDPRRVLERRVLIGVGRYPAVST